MNLTDICRNAIFVDFFSVQNVIGTDISKAQIDNAPQLDNVSFRIAPGKHI